MQHNHETSTIPYEKIALDFFGPSPETNLKKKYILYAFRAPETSPFEMIFGGDPNIISAISRSPTLIYTDSIKKWKMKHDNTIKEAKEIIEVIHDETN